MEIKNIFWIMKSFLILNKKEFIIGAIFLLIPVFFIFFNKQCKKIYNIYIKKKYYFFGNCYVEFLIIYNTNIKEYIIKEKIKELDYYKYDFKFETLPNEEFLIQRKKEKIKIRSIINIKSRLLLNLKILERNLNKLFKNKIENFNELEFNVKLFNFKSQTNLLNNQKGKIKIKKDYIEISTSKFENIDFLLNKVLK